jgi:hypothetical protein
MITMNMGKENPNTGVLLPFYNRHVVVFFYSLSRKRYNLTRCPEERADTLLFFITISVIIWIIPGIAHRTENKKRTTISSIGNAWNGAGNSWNCN